MGEQRSTEQQQQRPHGLMVKLCSARHKFACYAMDRRLTGACIACCLQALSHLMMCSHTMHVTSAYSVLNSRIHRYDARYGGCWSTTRLHMAHMLLMSCGQFRFSRRM